MFSTIALAASLLALTSAAPTTRSIPSVEVQFANDVTGAIGNAFIPLDATFVPLGVAYYKSNLEIAGTLNVTSLQFTSNFQNVECSVFKGTNLVAQIFDPATDFQKFSNVPLNWQTGFDISCHIAKASKKEKKSVPTVQVQFANAVTGANGNALIPLDGTPTYLGQAYANTNLEVGGTLFVTSLEFTANFQGVTCEVVKNGNIVASIQDPVRDFQKFNDKPVDWQNGFAIICN